MAYVPNPIEVTQPTADKPAGTAAAEFRALKQYIAGLVTTINTQATAITALQTASATFGVGMYGHTIDATAPAGWVRRNNETIGSAASGATERADADTINLYTLLWNRTRNIAPYIIQDSAGSATIRGADALTDFNANKRMPLPNALGKVDRGWNYTVTGIDANRKIDEDQTWMVGPHQHKYRKVGEGAVLLNAGTSGAFGLFRNDDADVAPNTGTENRMDNTPGLPLIKL